MGKAPARRPRLHVDVSEAMSAAVKRTADRFFRGAVSDVIAAAFSAFTWMLDQKRQGRKVISVEPDAMPERYSEAVLPGIEEALANERWTWLIERPHAWRRQLWIKGRRMRAAQLVGHMNANDWSSEETARQFDLPVEAVLEAQRYVDGERELIDAETIEEQRIARAMATAHPPEVDRAAAGR
ncbi:MAG: hypothetical protein ACRDGT_11015 [Candidatus Limnocylindria bacterium]